MPQKLKVTGPATDEQLVAARESRLDRHDQERLIAMQMAQQGEWKIASIAKAICIAINRAYLKSIGY